MKSKELYYPPSPINTAKSPSPPAKGLSKKPAKSPITVRRVTIKTPSDTRRPPLETLKDGVNASRDSDVWGVDYDEDNVLAEFQGAVTALEGYDAKVEPGFDVISEEPIPPDNLDVSLDSSFDATFDASSIDSDELTVDDLGAFVPEYATAQVQETPPDFHNSPLPQPVTGMSPYPNATPQQPISAADQIAASYGPPGNSAVSPIPVLSSAQSPMSYETPGTPSPSPIPGHFNVGYTNPPGPISSPSDAISAGPSRRFWALIAIVITTIVSVSAVFVTYIITSQTGHNESISEESPSQVILVKGNVVSETEEVTERESGAATRPTKQELSKVQATKLETSHQLVVETHATGSPEPLKNETKMTGIAQTFAHQRSRIANCFEKHALDVQGVPQIAINFVINPNGSVKSIALQPEVVRGTPLGNCISHVASATRFSPQDSEVEVRIPIKARRVP